MPESTEPCCIALRVQVTQDLPGGDVEILDDLPRVAFGEPNATLRQVIRYRLDQAGADSVLADLEEIGPLHPTRPLLLERLHEGDGGVCVHLEAKVLPVSRAQRCEFDELLAGVSDPHVWHEDAWAWAEILEEAWSAAAPDGRLPVRYLEDAFAESAAPGVDGDVPKPPAPALTAA